MNESTHSLTVQDRKTGPGRIASDTPIKIHPSIHPITRCSPLCVLAERRKQDVHPSTTAGRLHELQVTRHLIDQTSRPWSERQDRPRALCYLRPTRVTHSMCLDSFCVSRRPELVQLLFIVCLEAYLGLPVVLPRLQVGRVGPQRLLVRTQRRVPALRTDLALTHAQVVSHNEYQFALMLVVIGIVVLLPPTLPAPVCCRRCCLGGLLGHGGSHLLASEYPLGESPHQQQQDQTE
mmetsp:Transcript_636/g.1320  ORF Transcript_636/g.1320 Transcript_636/m.1320 type:complete len:235 (+) Transcript_636:797-1501(+)